MKKNEINKIFIVEDNLQYQALLAMHLEERFQVQTFSSGEEALQALHLRPDVVFLDYNFVRGKNGLTILQEIKRFDHAIQVVLLSGEGTVDIAVQALKKGAIDYIEKKDDSLQAVDQVLARLDSLQNRQTGKNTFMGRFFKN